MFLFGMHRRQRDERYKIDQDGPVFPRPPQIPLGGGIEGLSAVIYQSLDLRYQQAFNRMKESLRAAINVAVAAKQSRQNDRILGKCEIRALAERRLPGMFHSWKPTLIIFVETEVLKMIVQTALRSDATLTEYRGFGFRIYVVPPRGGELFNQLPPKTTRFVGRVDGIAGSFTLIWTDGPQANHQSGISQAANQQSSTSEVQ
ncbi:hypothetical protein OQA88_7592 [Cercophora sp. LCS_1]